MFLQMASFQPPELVVGTTWNVNDGLINCLTHEDPNILHPSSIWAITTPPSMWMDSKEASYHLDSARNTNSRLSVGSLGSFNECAMLFGQLVCRSKNATFWDCSFATFSITFLISLDSFRCGGAGMVRAGLGMDPKFISAGHRPFCPTVQLPVGTACCKHFLSLLWQSTSVRIRPYAKSGGAWYLLTTPIALGVSIGASSRQNPKGSKVFSISSDVFHFIECCAQVRKHLEKIPVRFSLLHSARYMRYHRRLIRFFRPTTPGLQVCRSSPSLSYP